MEKHGHPGGFRHRHPGVEVVLRSHGRSVTHHLTSIRDAPNPARSESDPSMIDDGAADPDAALRQVQVALAAHGYPVVDLVALTGGYGGTNLRATTSSGSLAVKVRQEPRPLQVIRTVSRTLAHRRVSHPGVLVPPTLTSAGWILGLRWVAGRSLVDSPASLTRPGRSFARCSN